MTTSINCRYCPYRPTKSVDRWGNEFLGDEGMRMVDDGCYIVGYRAYDNGSFIAECDIPFEELGYPAPDAWVDFLASCPWVDEVGGFFTSRIPGDSDAWTHWLRLYYAR